MKRIPAFLVVSLLLAPFLVGAPVPARAVDDDRVWIALENPPERTVESDPTGLLELAGRAGAGRRGKHDVVIALDFSSSTLLASGVDVDGDGKIGRMAGRVERLVKRGMAFPPGITRQHMSSDTDDTIRMAEIAAAQRLVELLNPETTRVGIITFANFGTVQVPLTDDRSRVRDVLAELRVKGFATTGGTDFEQAIKSAIEAFGPIYPTDPRQRSLVFLSDGRPEQPPPPEHAEQVALEAARSLVELRIRVHCFALGPQAIEHIGFFRQLAETTGGRTERVETPGEIVMELPRFALSDVARVEVANRTTGDKGRAVRVFPDGSFDGFVRLAPGRNKVRVTAFARTGTSAALDRLVTYRKSDTPDAAAVERAREKLERLKGRTLEIEAERDLERARDAKQHKHLDLDPFD